MFIRFITTGGTIDKIYFDALSQFEVGESQVKHILTEGRVDFDYEIVPLLQKDSLEMTDADRSKLRDYIENDAASRFVVTHGTDTMPATADVLDGLDGKTIILTGAPTAPRSDSPLCFCGLCRLGKPVRSWRCTHPASPFARPPPPFPR